MTTQREAAMRDRGTPQTRKKSGPGTMQKLIESKRIGAYELRAAEEIERIYGYITHGLGIKIMLYDERTSPGTSNHEPPWLGAYHRTYEPWANANPKWFSLVKDIVIEGWTFRGLAKNEYDRRVRLPRRFIQALRDYATRAQWVDAGTLDDWRREMEKAA